jgi:23S rRNA (cytosine1962-C5)-methyltransferase
MSMKTLTLRPGPHRVLNGSPWIYRTELRDAEAEAGAVVAVATHAGRHLGYGFYNPHSMIAVRMVSWGGQPVTADLIAERVRQAARLRQRLLPERDAYRVAHAEADGLPGLVIDRYGPVLVLEVTSIGWTHFLAPVVDTLLDVFQPQAIFEHGDLPVREREGLPRENRVLYGHVAAPVVIHEHGLTLGVNPWDGQKTGHFLDQYANRGRTAEWAQDREVFDAFCYTGGFGLVAARAGARHVVGIDLDPKAIAQAEHNRALNGLQGQVDFVVDNAFDWLRRESRLGPHFDLGILDPPAFTKSKASLAGAARGYKEINLRALKLLRPGGILVTSSCSYHLSESDFIRVIQQAAWDAGRMVRILEVRGQGLDHPVLPALPESRYLKCLIVAVE